MTAADVAATFNRLADPANKSNALSRLPGRAQRGWCDRSRRRRPSSSSSTAPNGELAVARVLGQLQRDHPPGELRRRLGADLGRHGSLEARVLHAEGRRRPRPQRRPTGASRPSRIASRSPSTTTGGGGPRSSRASRSTRSTRISVADGRAIIEDTANFTVLKHPGSTHRQLSMRTDRSRSPTSACARRSRSRSTGRRSSRRSSRDSPTSATTARSRRSSLRRTPTSRSAARTSSRRSSS